MLFRFIRHELFFKKFRWLWSFFEVTSLFIIYLHLFVFLSLIYLTYSNRFLHSEFSAELLFLWQDLDAFTKESDDLERKTM